MPATSSTDLRRRLPSVDQVLQDGRPRRRSWRPTAARASSASCARSSRRPATARPGRRDAARGAARDLLRTTSSARLARARRPRSRRVLNATGVVVHTNLGPRAPARAPPRHAWPRSPRPTRTSSTTSPPGERGDREVHAEERLRALLGVEATAVVNNCAAAVLLAVNTFAEGTRGAGEPGRAGGDRRLVPDPRDPEEGRRAPASRWAPPTGRASPTTRAPSGPTPG